MVIFDTKVKNMSTSAHCTLNVKRNSRERKRVQNINVIIRELKDKLPVEWTSKKMGKLEILQKSTLYIRHLLDVLNDSTAGTEKNVVEVPTKSSNQMSEEESLLFFGTHGASTIFQPPTPSISVSQGGRIPLDWDCEQNSLCMQQELTNFLPISEDRGICENIMHEGNSSDVCLSPCYNSITYKDRTEQNSALWF